MPNARRAGEDRIYNFAGGLAVRVPRDGRQPEFSHDDLIGWVPIARKSAADLLRQIRVAIAESERERQRKLNQGMTLVGELRRTEAGGVYRLIEILDGGRVKVQRVRHENPSKLWNEEDETYIWLRSQWQRETLCETPEAEGVTT